jgi:tetratricopeptide (TPR) repeat protein
LVSKSLLTFNVDGILDSIPEPRYRLLETVREYASVLRSPDELDRLWQSHAEYYLELARSLNRSFVTPEQSCSARLEADTANFRKATAAWIESGSGAQALDMAFQMGNFWIQRGYLSEGRAWFEKALLTGGPAPTMDRVIVLQGAGMMAHNQGDLEQSRNYYREALQILQGLGRPDAVASAHNGLGSIARSSGNYLEARAEFGQALNGNRTLGLELCIAANLANLGMTAKNEGAYEEAHKHYKESLEIARRHDSPYLEAGLRNCLAILSLRSGATTRARFLLDESLAISRRIGNRESEALSLQRLGALSRVNGETSAGLHLLHEALAMQRELGDRAGAASTLEEIAFALTGDPRREDQSYSAAVTLIGAADALRVATGVVRPLAERDKMKAWQASARSALGEEAYCCASARGQSMSLAQAVSFAPYTV